MTRTRAAPIPARRTNRFEEGQTSWRVREASLSRKARAVFGFIVVPAGRKDSSLAISVSQPTSTNAAPVMTTRHTASAT